jgi:hypothetical protein
LATIELVGGTVKLKYRAVGGGFAGAVCDGEFGD